MKSGGRWKPEAGDRILKGHVINQQFRIIESDLRQLKNKVGLIYLQINHLDAQLFAYILILHNKIPVFCTTKSLYFAQYKIESDLWQLKNKVCLIDFQIPMTFCTNTI